MAHNWKYGILATSAQTVVETRLKDVSDRKILHTQNFFKVQYIIIQAILSRKSMTKFAVTDEKNIPCL